MAGLVMGASEVLHEEARIHVHESLYHLRFFRDLIRRTGLVERAEQVGWMFGDPMYVGFSNPWEMESDHLNRILAILDLPGEEAWVDDCMGVQEGEQVLEEVESGITIAAGEEDLLATICGEQEDLDRLVGVLRDLKPELEICRLVEAKPETKPETLAEAWGREEEKPHVAILLRQQGEMYSGEIYSGLFDLLIQSWEVMKGGDED